MKFLKQCPCCHKKISFKELFSAWMLASKKSDKLVRCSHCLQPIQKLSVYENYGLFGALPLFGVPLVYSNLTVEYFMVLGSVVYTFLLFWLLYIKIPLICQNQYGLKDISKETKKDSRIEQYIVAIIAVVFFISIISMFFSFATTMKEKSRQHANDHNISILNSTMKYPVKE